LAGKGGEGLSDRILLEGFVFYGYHGVRPDEKNLGQRFVVDLALEADLAPAGRSDDLGLSIDYGEVYRRVREVVEGGSRDTLEAVAEEIAASLLEHSQRIQSVTARVSKPGAPIAGAQAGTVAVEIRRHQRGHDG
jgi:dihydroneopterin aldolase